VPHAGVLCRPAQAGQQAAGLACRAGRHLHDPRLTPLLEIPMTTQPMDTQQKIALVTGGTRGIGLETARQLAQAGVHVLLAGRDGARAVQAALRLQAEGLSVDAVELDVEDAGSIDRAVVEVERRHDRLDILVNNAGILLDDPALPVSGQSLATWRR